MFPFSGPSIGLFFNICYAFWFSLVLSRLLYLVIFYLKVGSCVQKHYRHSLWLQ